MLIEIEALRHRIAGREVLAVEAWHQAAGEHALVIGPSGAGKSTFINIICGLVTPSEGVVRIDGERVDQLPAARRDALRRRAVGLVFQTLRLIPALTVRANLALAQRIGRGVDEPADVARLIERVGLGHRADARPRQLSQGEGQRAAIARALVTRPKLVVADEPTSALDDANASRILDLLFEAAADTGATLLVATHDTRLRRRFGRTLPLAAPECRAAA